MQHALRGLYLRDCKEFFGIVGRNGSGKEHSEDAVIFQPTKRARFHNARVLAPSSSPAVGLTELTGRETYHETSNDG